MARKRQATVNATAASSRPSKKRKSAEVALAKIEELKDEELLSEDEAERDDLDMQIDRTPDSEEDEDDADPAPLGFVNWRNTTKRASGAPVAQVSELKKTAWKYTQTVEFQAKNAFTLKPLVLTDGSLKGCHVVVLQLAEEEAIMPFRFLDLPTEIRLAIYDLLLEEPDTIKINSYKPTHQPRRPVRSSFVSGRYTKRPGLTWDRVKGKWEGQDPSPLAIFGVSRVIQREAAPIVYGKHKFELGSFSEVAVFLNQIGSMRQHIKDLVLKYGWSRAYQGVKARSVFHKLKNAKNLRSISISHDVLCGAMTYHYHKLTAEGLVHLMTPLLQVLHKTQQAGDSLHNVLDLVQITEGTRCWQCGQTHSAACLRARTSCKTPCVDERKHCKKLAKNIRELIAKTLHIDC